jgi:UDP-2,3-diacylglucosamine hydrolase
MIPPAIENLGIIAGSRSLPLAVAREARRLGVKRLIAVGFENETSPELAGLVDQLVWVRVGQLTKLIEAFTRHGVRHCVMAGQVAPKNLFDLRPDWRALALLLRLKEKNAHSLFGAVARELQRAGVELIEATPWLGPLLATAQLHLGPKLSAAQREDVAFGFRIAKEISRLDIGQTVVVKKGTVLAVEAFEGTDPCLTRGGSLAGPGGGAVAVKVAKEDHDMRFDIPCIGPQTLETCAAAGIAVLALQAEKTLVLEMENVAQLARRHRVAVTAVG